MPREDFEPLADDEQVLRHNQGDVLAFYQAPMQPALTAPLTQRQKLQATLDAVEELEKRVLHYAKSDQSRDRMKWAIDRMFTILRREL